MSKQGLVDDILRLVKNKPLLRGLLIEVLKNPSKTSRFLEEQVMTSCITQVKKMKSVTVSLNESKKTFGMLFYLEPIQIEIPLNNLYAAELAEIQDTLELAVSKYNL